MFSVYYRLPLPYSFIVWFQSQSRKYSESIFLFFPICLEIKERIRVAHSDPCRVLVIILWEMSSVSFISGKRMDLNCIHFWEKNNENTIKINSLPRNMFQGPWRQPLQYLHNKQILAFSYHISIWWKHLKSSSTFQLCGHKHLHNLSCSYIRVLRNWAAKETITFIFLFVRNTQWRL